MGSSIFLCIILFSVFHLNIFHQPLIFAAADSNLILTSCKSTKYYDLCVSSLKSNPRSSHVDTKGLANIMIGVGLANATATSSYLSSQLLIATNDIILKKVLQECADKYTNAGDSLQNSAQDLAAEEFDLAYMHVLAAADYPNACHNAFRRVLGLPYPPELAKREDGLKQICGVVLGIIDHIISTS